MFSAMIFLSLTAIAGVVVIVQLVRLDRAYKIAINEG